MNKSYDYQDKKRDLSWVINTVIKKAPGFLWLLGWVVTDVVATNTKHEWMEDVVSPKEWTLNANHTSWGTELTLVSTTWVKVNDILWFEKLTGWATNWATSDLQAKVTVINSATSITVSVYGWTTDEDITATSRIFLVARPKPEGEEAWDDDGRLPTTEYNYTQIFARTAKVSWTSQSVKKFWIESAIDQQVEVQLQDISFEAEFSLLFGSRVLRTASENWTLWGMLYYLKRANWNKINVGWALADSVMNDWLALSLANGWIGTDVAVMNPIQKRKLAEIYKDKLVVVQADQTRWIEVSKFYWDLGWIATVLAVNAFDKDKIALIDSTKHKAVALEWRNFWDEDASPKWADYFARVIRWEITYECKNAQAQTLITWLTM